MKLCGCFVVGGWGHLLRCILLAQIDAKDKRLSLLLYFDETNNDGSYLNFVQSCLEASINDKNCN